MNRQPAVRIYSIETANCDLPGRIPGENQQENRVLFSLGFVVVIHMYNPAGNRILHGIAGGKVTDLFHF